jgi:hypothetical protein
MNQAPTDLVAGATVPIAHSLFKMSLRAAFLM